MAIKVQIPAGAESVTVRGLYQWDYGQVLEIESVEIGSEILEAHFACHNMPEAVVRVCSFTNGVGTVTIPDQCLEQTGAVTVWLCEVDSTQAHTIKTISLPITARTRPSRTRDVPTDFVDAYGQLIEEVNEAVDAIEHGNVTAAKATYANTAGHATTAGSAAEATHASTAGHASTADVAQTTAGKDLILEFAIVSGKYADSITTTELAFGKKYIVFTKAGTQTQSTYAADMMFLCLPEYGLYGESYYRDIYSTKSAHGSYIRCEYTPGASKSVKLTLIKDSTNTQNVERLYITQF